MNKVGVGIVTFNRPHFFSGAVWGVVQHLRGAVDYITVYNDGSDVDDYAYIYRHLPKYVEINHSSINSGVASAKNFLLKSMIEEGCDYLFLLEDDLIPRTTLAITRYIEACQSSGYEHFNFAHHGPGNKSGPVREEGELSFYSAISGAWSFYTRNVINAVGYMDTHFHNAWEHMEHTWRIAKAGLTSPFWHFADVRGSERWFSEQGDPENLANHSVIRSMEGWLGNIDAGLEYWRSKDADCPL